MTETRKGFIPPNPDGSFAVPRPLRELVSMSTGALYNQSSPTFIRFDENNGNPDTIIAQVEGDSLLAQHVIDLAWVYGEPFLIACEQGQPPEVLSLEYQAAKAGIRKLS